MRKLCYKIGTILLLVIFLLSGICWYYAEQILDQFIRPGIEKTATQLLEARVQIKQLEWADDGLTIQGLRIKAPQQFQVTIPQVDLEFTLGGLWHRQLEKLNISEPQIEIFHSQSRVKTAETALKIPKKLPFTIKNLTLSDGQLLINSAGRQWQLRELNFSGVLQQNSTFTFSTFFGPDDTYPLDISGAVKLSRPQTLSIKSLSWQKQQLITEPLQIVLAGADFTLDRTIIHLPHINHSKLQGIFTALGQPLLLPKTLSFSLADVDLIFSLQNRLINLELQVAKGLIDWDGLRGTLTQLKVVIEQRQQGWLIAGQLQGPAQVFADFNAALDTNNNLLGQAHVDIPDSGRLKTELLGGSGLDISGGARFTADYSLQGEKFQLTTAIQGQPTIQKEKYLLNIGNLSGQGKLLLSDGTEEFSLDLQLDSHPFFSAAGSLQKLHFSLTAADLHQIKDLFAPTQLPAQIQGLKQLKIAGTFARYATSWGGDINLTAAEIALPNLELNQLLASGKLSLNSNQLNWQETSVDFILGHNDELNTQVNIQGSGEVSPRKFSWLYRNYLCAT